MTLDRTLAYRSILPLSSQGNEPPGNDPGNDPGCTCGVLKYIAPSEGSVALTPFYTKHKYDNPRCPVCVQGPRLLNQYGNMSQGHAICTVQTWDYVMYKHFIKAEIYHTQLYMRYACNVRLTYMCFMCASPTVYCNLDTEPKSLQACTHSKQIIQRIEV